MAQYTVTFDKNYGNRLQSTKDSSVANIPAFGCTDLRGCGDDTHLKGGYAVTANVLDNCIPQGVGLQFSISSLATADPNIDADLFSYQGDESGVAMNTDVSDLINYALAGITDTGVNFSAYVNPANIIAALGLPSQAGAVEIQLAGQTINIKSTGVNRRLVATLGRPAVTPLVDICENQLGWSASTNAAVFGFDPNTCQPSLIWQMSVKVAYSVLLYETAQAAKTTVATDVTNKLLATVLADYQSCSVNVTSVEDNWRDILLAIPVTIGAA